MEDEASVGSERASASSSSMLQLAKMIRRGESVVFVTGSGLSAPSGIPTFRGSNGVWAKWVLDWGTRHRFLQDPRAWWNKFWIPAHVVAEPGSTVERQYEPSAGHLAISALAAAHRSCNVRVITQNIDGLHSRAGLPADRLVEVHGRGGLFKCVTRGCRYAQTESIEGCALQLVPLGDEAAQAAPLDGAAEDSEAQAVPHDGRDAGDAGDSVGGGATVIGELPTCPACGAPSLPQTLLFDEDYESHSFFQYRKARRWLGSAKAVVFVGTSFAVGVTEQALQIAEDNSLPTFSFNIVDADPAPHEASLPSERLPAPVMHHIIGGCEVTLPKLAQLAASPLSSRAADWYEGVVPSAVEREVLAGLGVEWTERTSGDSRKMRSRGKKRNRSAAALSHETTWVACDSCGKWRRLPPGVRLDEDEAELKWHCAQNIHDPLRQSCDAEEEPWG